MDSKKKANFILSVANGEGIPCPKCDSLNPPENHFCNVCGSSLTGTGENSIPKQVSTEKSVNQEVPNAIEQVQDGQLSEEQKSEAKNSKDSPFERIKNLRNASLTSTATSAPKKSESDNSTQKNLISPESPFGLVEDMSSVKDEIIETPTEAKISAFAHGLPEWSLEPPVVMVRRKTR